MVIKGALDMTYCLLLLFGARYNTRNDIGTKRSEVTERRSRSVSEVVWREVSFKFLID